MCVNPILIPNPNFGLKSIGHNYMKDCTSKYIPVPCGHCPECIAIRQMGIVQRMNVEYKFNHLLFIMCSYRPKMLPVLELSNGWRIPYADWKDLQNAFKRLRKRNAFGRPFRYLAVCERGERGHRPHFHIILILKKYSSDDSFTPINLQALVFKEFLADWKRNTATRVRPRDGALVPDNWHPHYEPLLEYHRAVSRSGVKSNYSVEYIRPLSLFSTEDAVSFYISKYVMKSDKFTEDLRSALELNLEEDYFKEVWSIVGPKCRWSHGFGVDGWPQDVPYIEKDVDFETGECTELLKFRKRTVPSKDALQYVHRLVSVSSSGDSPKFLAENGAVYPLSRYYYHFGDIIDEQLAARFFRGSEKEANDGVIFSDLTPEKVERSQERYKKQLSLIHNNSQL